MKRLVFLVVATCLMACGPPTQQAPVKQPDLSTPPEHKPDTLGGKEVKTGPAYVELCRAAIQNIWRINGQDQEEMDDLGLMTRICLANTAPDDLECILRAKTEEHLKVCDEKHLAALPPKLDSVLKRLTMREPVAEGYDRKDWKHWVDEDKDCQDTRQEVLIEESEVPVTFKTERNCKVLTGKWTCPYTGEVFTDPGKLDVDHMIPLGAAHGAGGYDWDANKKRAFANDLTEPEHLIAVKASANRSKGKRTPNEWLPDNEDYVCEYVQNWIAIKYKWKLTISEEEHLTLDGSLDWYCSEYGLKAMSPECRASKDPLCGL